MFQFLQNRRTSTTEQISNRFLYREDVRANKYFFFRRNIIPDEVQKHIHKTMLSEYCSKIGFVKQYVMVKSLYCWITLWMILLQHLNKPGNRWHSVDNSRPRINRVQMPVNCQEFNGSLTQQFLDSQWVSGLPEMMPCNYHLWAFRDVYQTTHADDNLKEIA